MNNRETTRTNQETAEGRKVEVIQSFAKMEEISIEVEEDSTLKRPTSLGQDTIQGSVARQTAVRQEDSSGTRESYRKDSRTRGEVVRLSLDVSPELNETLETLAQKIHGSKSDVLRKAVALMEVAVRAKEDKKKFGVAAPGQTLETEIVGL
jgi:predicted transcriptional regulator